MIVYTEDDTHVFREETYNDDGIISFFLEVNPASNK